MVFREDQKPIMEYEQGTMAIPAVPGAGKTFIIANLVASIVEKENNKPGKVLIVTYMNSAVNNFKSRINKILEEKGINGKNDIDVMTIHSLGLKILKDRPDVVMVNDDFQIIDDTKKGIILKHSIENWRKKDYSKMFYSFLDKKNSNWDKAFSDVVMVMISTLKLYDIHPHELEGLLHKLKEDSLLKAVFPIYKAYDETLKAGGYLDYDDLLILAYKILEIDDNAKVKFQKKYTYVFEDECQDSNLIQGKILTMLSGKSNNLVRVGDINQSITGTFTSSDPRFFKEFCENAAYVNKMDMANRSSKDIIGLANYLVDYVIYHHPEYSCRNALANQKIRPVPKGPWGENPKTDKYGIIAYREHTWEDEIKKTIKWISSFKNKYPQKTIAILVPNNSHVGEVAQRLKESGIEYDELSSTSEKKLRICKGLGYILNYLSAPFDNGKFIKILEWFLEDRNDDKKRTLMDVLIHNPLENILYPMGEYSMDEYFPESLRGTDIVKDFQNKVMIIRKILAIGINNPSKLILEIADILNFSIEERAMADLIVFYVNQRRREEPHLTIGRISEELLKESNNIFRHMADVIYDLHGFEPTSERVTISTYHRAKGLEWDCVFLLGMTAYNFPSLLSQGIRSEYGYLKEQYKNPTAIGKWEIEKIKNNSSGDDPVLNAKIELINERIRLIYVGITRAKEFLVLMSHQYNTQYKKAQEDSLYFLRLCEFINKKRSSGHD